VLDHFQKYRMNSLLGDINVTVGRKNIFNRKIGHESLYQDSNDNGFRLVIFATS